MKRYFVDYNGKYIAEYKSIKACLNFIVRKGLKDDDDNMLLIWDDDRNMYNSKTGEQLNDEQIN